MRKTGIHPPTVPRQGIRATSPDPAEPPRNALRRKRKTHFLEPFRLARAARADLIEGLSEHGIGDAESRDLFAAAVEYGIASCRSASSAPPVSPRPPTRPVEDTTHRIRALATAATGLADQFEQLDATARADLGRLLRGSDPFDRPHEAAYLSAIERELRRIAAAASSAEQAQPADTAPTAAAAPPQSTRATGRLVARIADAYEACFETKASDDPSAAFIPVLRRVAAAADISLPVSDAELTALIQSR